MITSKELITGDSILNFLTTQEHADIKLLQIPATIWQAAILTGSRAFGTANEDSDLDIMLPAFELPRRKAPRSDNKSVFHRDYESYLPEPWELKPLNEPQEEEYPNVNLNMEAGRLNLFCLTSRDHMGYCDEEDRHMEAIEGHNDYYKMYADATEICLASGNKEIFKRFIYMALQEEWYMMD